MTAPHTNELRALIRDLISEMVPQLEVLTTPQPVSITDNDELTSFVRRVVDLADNPLTGPLLRSGRLTFQLDSARRRAGNDSVSGSPDQLAGEIDTIEVDRGVLSERIVARAVTAHARLLLAKGVVITPLAREQIRKNSVEVVRLS